MLFDWQYLETIWEAKWLRAAIVPRKQPAAASLESLPRSWLLPRQWAGVVAPQLPEWYLKARKIPRCCQGADMPEANCPNEDKPRASCYEPSVLARAMLALQVALALPAANGYCILVSDRFLSACSKPLCRANSSFPVAFCGNFLADFFRAPFSSAFSMWLSEADGFFMVLLPAAGLFMACSIQSFLRQEGGLSSKPGSFSFSIFSSPEPSSSSLPSSLLSSSEAISLLVILRRLAPQSCIRNTKDCCKAYTWSWHSCWLPATSAASNCARSAMLWRLSACSFSCIGTSWRLAWYP